MSKLEQEQHSSGFEHGRIKVIGVGGGGGNAVSYMVEKGLQGAKIYALNTDKQALDKNLAPNKVQIGEFISKGLGAGANPEVGLKAAQESMHYIEEAIADCDMLFITAGMGGGTGTGAAGIIAEVAKRKGIVTVGVVTTPFSFEGRRREVVARQGISALQEHVNSLIVIPNDKLRKSLGDKTTLMAAFHAANDVLYNAMSSMTGIIRTPGHINVDFADVKTVMASPGLAVIGTGHASGEDRILKAVEKAISCDLLEDIELRNAKGLLVCVTSSNDISLGEFTELGDKVAEIASADAPVIIGTSIKEDMGDAVDITIIATGFDVDVTTERYNTIRQVKAQQQQAGSLHLSEGQTLARKVNVDGKGTPT
ncbi:cell division protein FtsZ [Caedibacter taeniospiralis]|jgi:cell division protein FtsZ|uniref:cell division protein FtsZ n=1 Tax=Caedibacter taeniospiralis TaxID=28907 RepID=UPI0037C0B095